MRDRLKRRNAKLNVIIICEKKRNDFQLIEFIIIFNSLRARGRFNANSPLLIKMTDNFHNSNLRREKKTSFFPRDDSHKN